jgi:hypothetical protein
MKKKKLFLIICLIFGLIAIVSVISIFIVPNVSDTTSQVPNYSYGKNESNKTEDTTEKNPTTDEGMTFYINHRNITKSIEMSGDTKIFKLSFSLFVKNNSYQTTKIMTAGFFIEYDISDYGTFLSSECTNFDESLMLDENEINELKFEVKYVISSGNFDNIEKYDLDIDYFGENVYKIKL